MGQKINPVVFRQSITNSLTSSWFTRKDVYSHLILQELYIRDYISFLLQSRGIFLRSCKIVRNDQCLFLDLDLYFSYTLSTRSKILEAKSFFKTLKKKYTTIQKIKNLKYFLVRLQSSQNVVGTNSGIGLSLDFKQRFLFFLFLRITRKFFFRKKKKISLLSIFKHSNVPKILRIKFFRLSKLFKIRKLKLNYQYSNFNYSFFNNTILSSSDLLELNKFLCNSLQKFTGVEKVCIKFSSNQLLFLSGLKLFLKVFSSELFFYKRNKHISLFFFEILEVLYFVLGTFSKGNATLLANLLAYMFETSRSHIFIVRFLKKVLGVFFLKFPAQFLVVNGIKILIKGRFNKRRRTKTLVLQHGQVSLQTISNPVDYFHTVAVTLYGTFGIKVWLSKKSC